MRRGDRPFCQLRPAATVAALASLVALAPMPAHADDGDRIEVGVFVVDGPGAERPVAERAELTRAFEKALRSDRRLRVRDVDEALAEHAKLIPRDALSELRGLVELGEALLARGRADQAVLRFEAAVAAMGPLRAHVRPGRAARAQFLLGAAHAMQGRTREARQVFDDLRIWQPDYQVDSSAVSAAAIELWRSTGAQVEKLPKGALDLTSTPAGARVYVDGRLIGRTPAGVEGLLVGTHYVTFELAGHQRVALEVPVYKHTRQPVETALDPLPGRDQVARHARALAAAATVADKDDDAVRAAAALAELIGLAHAVVLTPDPSEPERYHAAVFETASGRRLAAATLALPAGEAPDAALTTLTRTLYSGVTLDAEAPDRADRDDDAEPTTASPPLYQRWWFWTGVAAVAAAVVTPVILLRDDGDPSCPGGSVCGEVLWRF
ncbi:PEGA domain-containing protein [Haliangium sp.]|uniref:PEGA domain-containing protein n=1 Tax=Haliangium sp. TaxID=2663208 RepID=UPI003D115B67